MYNLNGPVLEGKIVIPVDNQIVTLGGAIIPIEDFKISCGASYHENVNIAESVAKRGLHREATVSYIQACHQAQLHQAAHIIGQSSNVPERLEGTQELSNLVNIQEAELKNVQGWANHESAEVNTTQPITHRLSSFLSDVVDSPRAQAALDAAKNVVTVSAGALAASAAEKVAATFFKKE